MRIYCQLLPRVPIGYVGQMRDQTADFPIDVRTIVASGRALRVGWLRRFIASDHQHVDEALAAMGLESMANRPFSALSGGQQQRALIARALASGSDLLLLDEPLASLDQPSSADLMSRLRRWLSPERLVVVVLHDLIAAREWCDSLLILNGHLVACGVPDECLRIAAPILGSGEHEHA